MLNDKVAWENEDILYAFDTGLIKESSLNLKTSSAGHVPYSLTKDSCVLYKYTPVLDSPSTRTPRIRVKLDCVENFQV